MSSSRWKSSRIFAVLLLTSFFCACTSTPSHNRSPNMALQQICFNGEGRGQISVLNRKHTFSFESKLLAREETWMLAINTPLQGEVSLPLPLAWPRIGQEQRSRWSAQLKKDVLSNWPKEVRESGVLEAFLGQVSHLFWHAHQQQLGVLAADACANVGQQCHFGPQSQWSWHELENGMEWEQKTGKEEQIKLTLTDEKNSRYERMTLMLATVGHSNYQGPLLKLDLHFASCD